jgi:amino acid permease
MNDRKNSQAAIEFIILISFMLFVILSFFSITSSKVLEARDEGNKNIAKTIAEYAYIEIQTAKSVSDGYIRNFTMPDAVNGRNYSVGIIDNREIVINYMDYEYVKFLPSNITGNISKGQNIITKANGIIKISPY